MIVQEKLQMSMAAWLETDGGRRCPQCGKFAKKNDLGDLSFAITGGRVSAYGHLPGFGCNKEKKKNAESKS